MAVWRGVARALLGLCACLLIGAAAAQPATAVLDAEAQAWLAEQGPIRLAPDPDFAPVDFIDVQGRHRGLSADLWAMLAQRTGLKTQLVRKRRFDEVLQALRAGEVDVASSVYQSPGRAQQLLFSNSYLRLPAALIAAGDSGAITQLSELRGRPIAVVQGHVWQELLATAGYSAELRPSPSIKSALTEVAEGRAAAYVGDLLSADPVLRKTGLSARLRVVGPSGLEAEIAFAMRLDRPELKRVLDQALASITVAEEAALRARWEGPNALAESDENNEVPASRASALAALKAEIESASGLADADRSQLLQRVETAMADDARADADIERVERIARELEQLPADSAAEADQASAAEELLRWRGSLPQRATPTQLEQLLVAEQSTRASLQETVTRLAQQAQALQQRPVALRTELGDLRTQLDALQVPEPSENLAARSEREAALARQRALRAGIYVATVEQANLDLLLQSVDLRKRERQRALAQRSERVRVLEDLIAERRDNVLEQDLARLRKVAEQYQSAAPAIRDLAAENLIAGQELAQRTRRLARLRIQAQQIESQTADVRSALENARARIAIGGVTEAVGMLLLAERRRLPNPPALRAQLDALQSEVAEVQLAQISVNEERDRLADIDQAVARLAGSDVDAASALNPEQRTQLTELLLSRLELLPQLAQLQQKSREVLEHAEQQLVQLLADSQTLVELMEQNLLWVPSHRPVDASWWTRLKEGWSELARLDRWSSSLDRLAERLPQQPLWILALLTPFALLLARPALGRRLQALAEQVRDVRADRMRYTLQALLISVVLASPMALFWWLLGSKLIIVGEAGRFTHSLGIALHGVVPYLFVLTSISVVCRDQGLAHAHLRWPRARRAALLRARPWLYFGLMPLLFLTVLSLARDIDGANGTVLRSTLVLVHLLAAAVSAWLLGPNRLLASRVSGADPWPRRRRLLRAVMVGGFLAQAALALLGYVFTSAILLGVSLNTLQVVYAVALVHGLVLRWLVIGERRVALAQQQQAGDSGDTGATAGLDVPQVAPDTVNLRAISEQSRSLLRALTTVALVTGLLWSLADVAPAFTLLDQVSLWQTSELVDGVAQARAITLGDAVLALVALLVGIIAARNIPGLLEIVLLKRFTEDASVRYAVVTVTRYLISFLMVVAVFGLLGVRWGHLQWLAAGFSVGLGFGLQEIFGNFVAGLILLFERPFRVGDVVTIGDLTGTVRRVRTRATTIVDFDNKDIVIPNKTFITERFVNWTLTDTTTRLILRVGVDYDSNPDEVRQSLLRIARRHPSVLAEPAPVAVFMLLADSTLNFELRCFVGSISDRLRVTDEIHSEIIREFRASGIRMAYPQLDVHLHPASGAGCAGATAAGG